MSACKAVLLRALSFSSTGEQTALQKDQAVYPMITLSKSKMHTNPQDRRRYRPSIGIEIKGGRPPMRDAGPTELAQSIARILPVRASSRHIGAGTGCVHGDLWERDLPSIGVAGLHRQPL